MHCDVTWLHAPNCTQIMTRQSHISKHIQHISAQQHFQTHSTQKRPATFPNTFNTQVPSDISQEASDAWQALDSQLGAVFVGVFEIDALATAQFIPTFTPVLPLPPPTPSPQASSSLLLVHTLLSYQMLSTLPTLLPFSRIKQWLEFAGNINREFCVNI